MLKKTSVCAAGILLLLSLNLCAQTMPQPGEWAFVVTTDLKSVPADMAENFPVVDYEKCLTAEEITSPRAFGLQASPAMWNRCSTENWKMDAGKLAYSFQCDGGATLSGEVAGDYSPTRVTLNLISRPRPVVRGVETIHQRIVAKRLGACKNPS
jgi:Protein of unknown function (DUF3617)